MFSGKILIRSFFTFCFLFSCFLMFQTFSYENGYLFIGSKLWSDFASHIPLIRSFSLGSNFPVEYPLFAGEPIHYHFLFYAFVGLLEKLGIPLDFALNIPSAIGFFLLLVMIYLFSKQLFLSKTIGILAVIFFLFNGSLSFIYFFQQQPFSTFQIQDVIKNTSFPSFAPYYGEGIVSAFWNLNIYTNQRHFAAAFALSLFIIYQALKPIFSKNKRLGITKFVLLGSLLGLSFYFHIAVFMMTVIILILLGIFFQKIRSQLFILLLIAGLFSYPQYLYMNSGGNAFTLQFKPGYLISSSLDIKNFIWYWFMNLGLHSLFIFIGFLWANKNQKKVFLAFLSMFVIGNVFQFSPEMAANHKFFNYFMLTGNMFTGFMLVKLWQKKLLKFAVILSIFFLTFSGIIDLFPILNDHKIQLPDYSNNKTAEWILNNTPADSIFLNHTFLLAPESLVGRKIFLGWPYFAWSQGYDTEKRGNERNLIFSSSSKEKVCSFLKKNNLTYVEINKNQENNPDQPKISNVFQDQFSLEYKHGGFEIYNVSKNCN